MNCKMVWWIGQVEAPIARLTNDEWKIHHWFELELLCFHKVLLYSLCKEVGSKNKIRSSPHLPESALFTK